MITLPLHWKAPVVTYPSQKQNGRRISTQAKQQCKACTSRGSSRWKGGLRNRSIVVTVLPAQHAMCQETLRTCVSYKPRSGHFVATLPKPFRHHHSYISNSSGSHADRFLQSSLVLRFVNNDFQENKEPTIGGTRDPNHLPDETRGERADADTIFT